MLKVVKNKRFLKIIISLTSLLLIGFFALRIDGFFVRFEDRGAVKNFLLENLELNVSTVEDVEAFMGQYTSRLENCDTSTSSNPIYDEVIYCTVLSHTTWMFVPFTRYYTIRFYFANDLLQEIVVGTWFIGP